MLLGIRYIATVISKLDPDAYINYANTINKPYVITPTSPQSMESRRIGVIGYKQGMTAIWNKWGVYTPCTVVQLDKPQVLSTRPHREKPGLFHAQVGGGYKKYFKLSKPEIGQFLKANVPPKKDIFQFTITKEGILPVGFMLTVRHFLPGQFVDVIGTSKGKGFQG
jgi:large subunit ribosomal protein L3